MPTLNDIFLFLELFFQKKIFIMSNVLQLLAITTGLFSSYTISSLSKKMFESRLFHTKTLEQFKKTIVPMIFPTLWCLIQWTIVAACKEFHWNYTLNYSVAEFITAWLVIRCIAIVVIQPSLRKIISVSVFSITTLNSLGLLPHLLTIMENVSLNIGDLHISLLSILKGGLTFFALLWGTITISRRVEKKLKRTGKIEPSLQELFTKLIRVSFIGFSLLITLSSVGLDLSAFAVFGGTIGVGIGFGLQKVVSNLICGIILLLDRSIKPGDVIALEQGKSYGEINRLGARCVSVRTRSGKEHLIPNEEFIIHKSENWSLSDSLIRLSLPMRAGLNSDVELVMKLLVEAAEGVERVIKHPIPGARLSSFSESAIEFELRVWINDPKNGVSKVKSDIYINIWKLFKQNGITIPHPQRDIHIPKSASENLSQLKSSFLNVKS